MNRLGVSPIVAVSAAHLCTRCVMDTTVPDIRFNPEGVCNYCRIHDRLVADYPRGRKGEEKFYGLVEKMRHDGRHRDHDCIVGVSGGTDSTYLIWLVKKMGLRPLAVNLDNGWHSEIAVGNIKQCLDKLGLDLRTYVVDWDEMRTVLLAFMRASLPWPDGATDIAITGSLYRVAAEEGVPYILVGNDFRSEGKQPREWTYSDGKMVEFIVRKFGNGRLRSFPNLTLARLLYDGFVRRIRIIRPFWYLEYKKSDAKKVLEKELEWRDYGGHHHESIFTRFTIGYWLPRKFNIDKRKVTFSALLRSGEITRVEALEQLAKPHYSKERLEEDLEYVIRKFGISRQEFERLMDAPNKRFSDYPSYYPFYRRTKTWVGALVPYLMTSKPLTLYEDMS